MANLEKLFSKYDRLVLFDTETTGTNPIEAEIVGISFSIEENCAYYVHLPHERAEAQKIYEEQGLEGLTAKLKELDPVWYEKVDLKNYRRVMHAVEVCIFTGKPYSSFLSGKKKNRDFEIEKIGLERPREELYDRINRRVDQMIADGLEEEARKVYHLRHLNSLNTVGFKEFFSYFSGEITKERAIELIKQNSRHYAKRQMTWFRRDTEIKWMRIE